MSRNAALLVFVLLAVVAPASAQPPPSRVLVVPFENLHKEPRFHWLAEASAVLVADGLRARGLSAIPRAERVRAFDHLRLPVAASLSRATIIKVGQLVGASEVIVGSFTVSGEQLVLKAHSIRVDVGRLQPETTERGELEELFEIYDRLARRLAREAPLRPNAAAHPPLDAFENYIKGLVAESPATKAAFLESAIREHAAFDRARLALWDVRYDQGDHDTALGIVQAVSASSPLARRARFFAGISLLELERFDEAFETLKRLLNGGTAAANAAVLNNLGVVQIRRGPTQQTGTPAYYLTQAADAEPDPDYLFNLGYAYVLEGNPQGAIYWLREALRREPGDADAHFVLAAALQATGSATEAARERDLARRLSARYEALARQGPPGHVPPRGLERLSLDLDGSRALHADRVVVTFAQREQRELAGFHLEQGSRLFEQERDGEAMAVLRRAVYLSPYEARAHLLIGRIHLRGARPEDAVDALKISIWSDESVDARIALAEAYLKTGNAAAAKGEVDRALKLDPESAEARRLLAEIERRQ